MWKWKWPWFKPASIESTDQILKRELELVFTKVASIIMAVEVESGLMHFSASVRQRERTVRLSLGIAVGDLAPSFDEAMQKLRETRDEGIPLDDLPPDERGRR